MQVIQKAHPLLLTLLKIQRKYNKDYSWPSQLKLMELMGLCQNIKKSRATINRWLRLVQDGKYVIRRRRIKKHRIYGLMFKSTLYKITIKGYRLLSRFGVDMSKEIAKYRKMVRRKLIREDKPLVPKRCSMLQNQTLNTRRMFKKSSLPWRTISRKSHKKSRVSLFMKHGI